MDDEDDSLSLSPPKARTSVADAAASPSATPSPTGNNLALATMPAPVPLQIQQPKTNGGGREDCWSEGATGVLIDAWGERYLELSRGNLKQKHWKEVADIVSSREDYLKTPKTDIQCKNRIDTVKKKYKLEKAKIASGAGPSKWPFFERLDHLIGPVAKNVNNNNSSNSNVLAFGQPNMFRTANVGYSQPNMSRAGPSGSVPAGIPTGIPVVRGGGGAGSGGGGGAGSGGGGSGNLSVPPQNIFQKVLLKGNSNSRVNSVRVQRWGHVETDSETEVDEEAMCMDSDDSLPPKKKSRGGVVKGGIVNVAKGVKEKKGWGSSIQLLTQAMLKFGEAYEHAESAKLQQVVEMEKARMKFARELELQRMQFFMRTQIEISQLKPCRKGGRDNGNSSKHLNGGNDTNVVMNNDNNCDSDN